MNTKTIKLSAESEDLLDDASNYDKNAYAKASNTADIAILRIHKGELQVLLGMRKHNPFKGMWGTPGGYVEIGKKEDLNAAALRELKEETHAEGIPIKQFRTYGDPDRDPRDRVITTVYYAYVSEENLKDKTIKGGDDIRETQWFNINKLPKLAFDHNMILRELLEQVKHEVLYEPIAFQFLNKHFTWTELQDVYELLLGRKLIAPNFRRKVDSMYKIKELQKKDESSGGRPPAFLRFNGVKSNF